MRVDKCNKSLVLAGGTEGLQSKRTTNVYSIWPLVRGPNGETGDICKHSVTLFFYSRAYTESYQVRGVRGALKLEVFVGRQLERAPKLIIEPSPCQGSMRSNP